MHKLRQLLNKNINRVQIRYAGKSRGDTMVEVIVSSAIIILALAGSYAISHRSLQQGTSSGLRSQALSAYCQTVCRSLSQKAMNQSANSITVQKFRSE